MPPAQCQDRAAGCGQSGSSWPPGPALCFPTLPPDPSSDTTAPSARASQQGRQCPGLLHASSSRTGAASFANLSQGHRMWPERTLPGTVHGVSGGMALLGWMGPGGHLPRGVDRGSLHREGGRLCYGAHLACRQGAGWWILPETRAYSRRALSSPILVVSSLLLGNWNSSCWPAPRERSGPAPWTTLDRPAPWERPRPAPCTALDGPAPWERPGPAPWTALHGLLWHSPVYLHGAPGEPRPRPEAPPRIAGCPAHNPRSAPAEATPTALGKPRPQL